MEPRKRAEPRVGAGPRDGAGFKGRIEPRERRSQGRQGGTQRLAGGGGGGGADLLDEVREQEAGNVVLSFHPQGLPECHGLSHKSSVD